MYIVPYVLSGLDTHVTRWTLNTNQSINTCYLLFTLFGLLAPKKLNYLVSNILAFSVRGEGYSRKRAH